MSVPTTLQGTHDGCGGKVTFRPATHRRELLAGQSVVLSAACSACGATLETPWQLPAAVIAAHQARIARPAEEAVPMAMAAGAEGWSGSAVADAVGHAASDAPAPPAGRTARPVANLGDWRLRARPEQPTTETDHVAAEHRPEPSRPEPTRHEDPVMQAYLDRFSSRVEHAREHLRQASTGLPSAFEQGDGGFRTPNLRRRPSLEPSRLSATPAALRPAEAPSAASVASAVEHAIASPSFHDDAATPLVAPRTVPTESAVATAEPVAVAAEPAVAAPEPIVAAVEPTIAAPEPIAAPVEPASMPVAPVAAEPAAVEPIASPVVVAPSAPAAIAPTDADVFPPEQAAPLGPPLGPPPAVASGPAPAAPAYALPLAAATQPASDAAASVWEHLPVAPAAAATSAAPAAPAPATPPAPSFGAAFDDAVDAGPPAGSPVAGEAPAMPELAGLAVPIEAEPLQPAPATAATPLLEGDASVAFEADRGFDWGPDTDSPALPRRRRLGRRRDRSQADPADGPEVIFEPTPDPDLAEARPRARVGFIHLALVLMLAVICGVAAFKVFSTEPVGIEPTTPVEPAVAVPPAEGAAGAPASAAAGGTAPAAGARGARRGAAPTTPPKAPGTPVADAPAAGTAGARSASSDGEAQVPAADADTPVVTASAATAPHSNPFARP